MKYALFTALLCILCSIAVASQYPTYQVPENFIAEWLQYNQTEAEEAVEDMVEITDDVSPNEQHMTVWNRLT